MVERIALAAILAAAIVAGALLARRSYLRSRTGGGCASCPMADECPGRAPGPESGPAREASVPDACPGSLGRGGDGTGGEYRVSRSAAGDRSGGDPPRRDGEEEA